MAKEWNLGDKKQYIPENSQEPTILVGLIQEGQNEQMVSEYLDELEFLAETAGAKAIKRFTQKMQSPDSRTFIGKGKAIEIKEYIEKHPDINMVLFDDDLTGKQTNILEEMLKVKIIDRSSLILDIFASRAQTAQAKTQVELAQMQYLLPRLRGLWTHLERQRGGIGMRGPGEKEIETDRRIVRDKIALLKEKLELFDKQSFTQRKNRDQMVRVALVGYTNAGKSTMMNALSKSDIFAENKLFATLDTTVRKVVFGQMPFLLSDTVGFIRKLPHHLVESFKSTLDEVRESDFLLHVVDLSHPQYEDQIKTVIKTLEEIGAAGKPGFLVCNKIDQFRANFFDPYVEESTKMEIEAELKENLSNNYQQPVHFTSALTGEQMTPFKEALEIAIKEVYKKRYPYLTNQW
ncbi:MAG: GTPase HflX [Saprospiraceae bacterium]